jgi:uridine kinase
MQIFCVLIFVMIGACSTKWQHNTRSALLKHVADKILRIRQVGGMTLVGIDGTDGSGKTIFADELAATLRGLEVPAIRASVDDFSSATSKPLHAGEE